MKIGILSDTHGFLLPPLFDFFADCDELWHAGDIGTVEVLQRLQDFKPLRAVYGNIDGQDIRCQCSEDAVFTAGGLRVCMTHIGGYPGHYTAHGLQLLREHRPQLFVSGHSHILKVMPDPRHGLMHFNPGAAGFHGWHSFTTALRFDICNGKPDHLEVYRIGRNEAATFRSK